MIPSAQAVFEEYADNRILAARAAGRTAYGMSIKSASIRHLEIAAHGGLDFVRIDLSGGNSVPVEALVWLIPAAHRLGITPVVRVDAEAHITSAFAAGALGVTLPHVNNVLEVQELSEFCRDKAMHLGGQLLVSVQIESIEALADVRAIAELPHVHMLQSGRNDLAKSMGLPGQPEHERVLEAEDRIAAAASDAGKLLSLHFAPGPHSIEQAKAWVDRKISCLTIGADTQILEDAVLQRVARIRP